MDNISYKILEKLNAIPGNREDRIILLNSLGSNPIDESDMLDYLIEIKFVSYVSALSNVVKLTEKGKEAFLSEKERRDENAKRNSDERAKDLKGDRNLKKQFRHDFIVAAFSILFALFIEHLPKIINAVTSFLSRFFS